MHSHPSSDRKEKNNQKKEKRKKFWKLFSTYNLLWRKKWIRLYGFEAPSKCPLESLTLRKSKQWFLALIAESCTVLEFVCVHVCCEQLYLSVQYKAIIATQFSTHPHTPTNILPSLGKTSKLWLMVCLCVYNQVCDTFSDIFVSIFFLRERSYLLLLLSSSSLFASTLDHCSYWEELSWWLGLDGWMKCIYFIFDHSNMK